MHVHFYRTPVSVCFQGSFAENLAFLLEALKKGLCVFEIGAFFIKFKAIRRRWNILSSGSEQVIAAAAAQCCSSWMSLTCSPTTRTKLCFTTCLMSPSLPRRPSLWSDSPADWWASDSPFIYRGGKKISSSSHQRVFMVLLLSGRPGAVGEARKVAVFPPSDPPPEQPDLLSVPGAGPSTAQLAGKFSWFQVCSRLERRYRGGSRSITESNTAV